MTVYRTLDFQPKLVDADKENVVWKEHKSYFTATQTSDIEQHFTELSGL